ncbi:cytochrome c oxidase subunit II [Bradyrhizobium sp. WSM 1738]|uniref:cytochrome c oxidase subunit II n=1 Tax=Bradyrhizobium hereditatis TaxID=2821405 RepID=UPI001CE37904|nr:cytochrome c oxidase subunit II [Bradyrhizobium hereditatis]MCA6119193.1 cytochrome c oxidase subunit II [Bradyrhizobium hereditatis]
MLAGCTGWQSAIDVQGAAAISIKQLIFLFVAVCSVVWAMVMAVLIRALWRGREERGRPADLDPQTERRMTRAVIAATAVTVVIVTVFTTASFFTTRALSLASHDDLTIKVRGQQWWWSVEYLSPPERRLQTANEIHIPVGQNVRLQLEGADVIHSFWVPNLAGKQDLIPGRPNTLTIRAERPGVYRGQCAEFCGLQHAHMAFLVIAEEPAAFERWVNSQQQSATDPSDADVIAGQQVFLSRPCAACHAIRGTSATGTTGPDLTHVGGRKYIAAGLLETTRGSLAAWIADPQTLKPGNNMPMVPLSADELRSVSAYLASLK